MSIVGVLGVPLGKLRKITFAPTAGNVATDKSPGVGFRWVILYGIITVVCDGNAANRRVAPILTDGTNIIFKFLTSASFTAGQTKNLQFGPTAAHVSGAAEEDSSHVAMGWPIIIENEDEFRIMIKAGLAGDSYSGTLVVLESPI